jgi:hypothetical protein
MYIFKYIEYSDPRQSGRPGRTIEARPRVAVGRLQVSQVSAPHDLVSVVMASSTLFLGPTAPISCIRGKPSAELMHS